MSKNIVKNDDMALLEKVVIGENWTGRKSFKVLKDVTKA